MFLEIQQPFLPIHIKLAYPKQECLCYYKKYVNMKYVVLII